LSSFGQTADELNSQSREFIRTQEFEKAIPLLRRAAELGVAESQYNFGVTLEFGYGIESNLDSAFYWYSKAAEQGWNDGLYKMMMAHAEGQGADKNFEKAFEYALKCAQNNDITCMFNVISAYYLGLGTTKNVDKMLEWAIKLATLSNEDNLLKSGKITSARLNLAQIYRDGKMVETDLIKSYCWYLIYNESKRDFSILIQENVIEEIKDVEKQLSQKQIKKARRLAEQTLQRPLQNLNRLYESYH
jgi:TPR repeat protein